MTIRSMTAFARTDGAAAGAVWHWEVRTVNGRGLDIRLRLPAGMESLESRIRDMCASKLTRGNVSVSLSYRREAAAAAIKLNEAVLRDVAAALSRAAELIKAAPPSLDGVLGLRGVLDVVEPEEAPEEADARKGMLLTDLDRALDAVVSARAAEGSRLAATLAGQIDEIATLAGEAEASPSRTPERIAQRLTEQVRKLLQAEPRLDEQRLHQEAALLAVKADIAEELQRLGSHIAAARELLVTREPVGRKLDFLTQEFNREANTLCSKSNDAEVTRIGLRLKAVIDQLREQVQNIE